MVKERYVFVLGDPRLRVGGGSPTGTSRKGVIVGKVEKKREWTADTALLRHTFFIHACSKVT